MRQAIEVSKMQGRGGFRALRRDRATNVVNLAVLEILGPEAQSHLAMIATAITKPAEPTSQKYLRRFGIDAEKLVQLKNVITAQYNLNLADRDHVDPGLVH
ncbi:MAG: hypothetical protein M3R24_12775 [Chloroflexota bacterium]|nr:hypothetical protein [Chloroflexota bacterium]